MPRVFLKFYDMRILPHSLSGNICVQECCIYDGACSKNFGSYGLQTLDWDVQNICNSLPYSKIPRIEFLVELLLEKYDVAAKL